MRSEEAEGRLRTMFVAAGVSVERPTVEDVQKTWEVMREFSAEPAEDADPVDEGGDGVLAQYGGYGADGAFQLDITRQFSFSVDGEYDHMTQLHCSFDFPSHPALADVVPDNDWCFEEDRPAFFEKVFSMPGFAAVRENDIAPTALDIGYGEV